MTDVVFRKRTGGGNLYWLDLSLPAGSSYAIAYNVSGTGLPDELTLTATWNDYPGGIYLFLASTPLDVPLFESRVALFLQAVGQRAIRFLWIANPDVPYPQWRSFTLTARLAQGAWSVVGLASFDLSNYSLIIGGGCPLTLAAGPSPGEVAGFSFARAAGSPDSLRFTSGQGRYSYANQSESIVLAMSGPLAGAFNFTINLPHDESDPDAPLAAIDAGLRYFVSDPQFPRTDLLSSLRFPILAVKADTLLYGALDPVQPLNPTRSYLGFVKDSSSPVEPVESYWRTALGHAIELTPSAPGTDTPGSCLVFGANPNGSTPVDNPPLYLTFAGAWSLSTATLEALPSRDEALEPLERVMPGIAGTEYLGIMDTGAHQLHFIPGQAAHAPAFTAEDPQAPSPGDQALVSLDGWLTTSWIYLTATAGNAIYYYAQPAESELYCASGTKSGAISMGRVARQAQTGSPGLALLEVPASVLPDLSPGLAFPSVPYAGLRVSRLDDYRRLELDALSPTRRRAIGSEAPRQRPARRTRFEMEDTLPSGVTPQGLLANFSADLLQWLGLTLAQTPRRIGAGPSLRLNQKLQLANITGGLKAALQTNQLFMVLSDPGAVLQCCSVTFRLTTDSFAALKASGKIPGAVADALVRAGTVDTFYGTVGDYESALRAALTPGDYQQYLEVLLLYGSFADLNLEQWLFHVSAYHWSWSGSNPTLVVFKYANRSLLDLAGDLSAWSWREGAGGERGALEIQQRLLAIITAAITAAADGRTDFSPFAKVAQSTSWNGILFLSVPVSLDELPPQLQGLAAGIDPTQFFAHHLGIEVSPVDTAGTDLQLANSSLFGLIDFESPGDLAYTGVDYDFKVLQLSVRFADSRVASFASRVEVQINRLFGSPATLRYPQNGNNIVLNGVYQQNGSTSSYVFQQSQDNPFDSPSPVLSEIDIRQVQFFTLVPSGTAADWGAVRTRFVFSGVLRFNALEGFDVFSYGSAGEVIGGLAFDGLILEMNFDQRTPAKRTFLPRADAIAIDPATSFARQSSFVSHFPLTFTGLLQGTQGTTPGDLGFMSVVSPLAQGQMDFPWYGLLFELELGSIGSLAASAGLTTTLIAAWSAADATTNVYVGLKMPGSVGAQTQIPIEGLLKLVFKKIEIVVMPVPGGPAPASFQYMLKFRGVSFNLLTLTFPPGDIDVYLFGNPATGDSGQLGWYAAYSSSEPEPA